MILLRIYRPNFGRFLRQRSPKKEAAAWSAYSWIRACCRQQKLIIRLNYSAISYKWYDRGAWVQLPVFNAVVRAEPINSGLRNLSRNDIVLWYGTKHYVER